MTNPKVISIIGSLAVLLAACSALPNAPAAGSGGSITIGASTDNYRLEDRPNVGAYPVNAGIYETLVRLSPDYQLEPALATEWSFVEPNTSVPLSPWFTHADA